jgi:hypothetical protein
VDLSDLTPRQADTLARRLQPMLGYWLGAYQPLGSEEPAGGWEWVTGEPFAHSNWAPGRPSDSSGEDRLHFFVEGTGLRGPTWNDIWDNGSAATAMLRRPPGK